MMATCFFCEKRPGITKRATMFLGMYYIQMPICEQCLNEEGLYKDSNGHYCYKPERVRATA